MDKNSNIFNIFVLIIFWCAATAVINPIGNFPLDDDWAYARIVQSLCMGKGLQFPGEVAISAISQALYGLLFCKIFGFSFVVLRCSNLILGLVGILAVYFLLKKLNASSKTAFIGAALLAVNPMYFALSYSFMSDIFFFTFSIFALYFFINAIKTGSIINIIVATLVSCIATLCRQIGILIPISFGVVYMFKIKYTRRIYLKALLPILLVFGSLFAYLTFLKNIHKMPIAYNCPIFDIMPNGKISSVVWRFFCYTIVNFIYMGLFLFPLSVILFPTIWHKIKLGTRRVLLFCSFGFFIILASMLWYGIFGRHLMPLAGNTLSAFGIGPVLLKGAQHLSALPLAMRAFMTAIGILGACLLLIYICFVAGRIFKSNLHIANNLISVFILLLSVLYAIAISLASGYCDRYQIILLPLLLSILIIAAGNNLCFKGLAGNIAILFIITYGLFSIVVTHDYLSWNRARWSAVSYLVEDMKVNPNNIIAGQDINAWYSYDVSSRYVCEKRWWWYDNLKNEYLIAFGPVTGYKELKRFPYAHWFSLDKGHIFALRKIST